MDMMGEIQKPHGDQEGEDGTLRDTARILYLNFAHIYPSPRTTRRKCTDRSRRRARDLDERVESGDNSRIHADDLANPGRRNSL
jgi:hypothetical protein